MSDELVKRISEKWFPEYMAEVEGDRSKCESAIREALEAANEWVSVEERLPEPSRGCLVACEYRVTYGWMRDSRFIGKKAAKWDSHVGVLRKVTHWRPLPDLPKAPAETEGK